MTLDCLSLHSTTTKTLFSFSAISYVILLLSPRTNIFPSFLFLNMYNTPLLIFCSSFPPFQSSYFILRSVLPAHYRISHASRYLTWIRNDALRDKEIRPVSDFFQHVVAVGRWCLTRDSRMLNPINMCCTGLPNQKKIRRLDIFCQEDFF